MNSAARRGRCHGCRPATGGHYERDRREATRDRSRKIGHSLVDDHSRLAYCEIHPDGKGPACAEHGIRQKFNLMAEYT